MGGDKGKWVCRKGKGGGGWKKTGFVIMRKIFNLYKHVKEKLARFFNFFFQKRFQKHYGHNLAMVSR